jgi:hypothetical protein
MCQMLSAPPANSYLFFFYDEFGLIETSSTQLASAGGGFVVEAKNPNDFKPCTTGKVPVQKQSHPGQVSQANCSERAFLFLEASHKGKITCGEWRVGTALRPLQL